MRTAALALAAGLLASALAREAGAGAAPRLTRVPARAGALAAALAAAAPGDTLLLLRGVHPGPARVTTRVTLEGEPGAVVDGPADGTPLSVAADGTVIEDLEIRHSGARLLTTDSGIQVIRAGGVTLRRLRIRDTLYGIYAERATGLTIEDCDLVGRVPPLEEDGDGNGINLWYCERPRMARNHITHHTDGIYLSFVNGAAIEGNRLEECGRYGLHTMYCQDNRIVGNHFLRNVAGCAIMFSNHLRVEGNDFWRNRGPRTYGLLLRDCSDGEFVNNRMVDNTIALFMDNSNRNRIHGNLLQDDGWGLLVFASCAQNEVAGNSFVNDDYPVALDMRMTTNRFDDGTQGNYWSDNAPYDLDADGRGDVPYSPVTAFAFVSKQYPDLSVMAKSPAVVALGVAERVIPALRRSEAVDHHPRLRPTPVTGTGETLSRPAARGASWGGRAAFAGLLLVGLGGLRRRRSRA